MGPLQGYRVLELGSTAAGPFCTRLLADFGAEVVKIEAPEGDPIRALGATVDGTSLYSASISRNKLNASLDLRTERGRDAVRAMIPSFDVVVENFRPGTLEKWGLSYEELSALRPGIVLTRVSGYGQTGPYRDRPGYGVIGEAMSGLREMIGDPDRPPSRVAIPLTDYIAGLYAAYGTLLALLARERTGAGQCVDTSLMESAFSFMEAYVPTFDKLGTSGTRAGPRLPNSAPNTLFPTGDGRQIHVAALADPVFRRLAVAMGRPELADDPRFGEQNARNAHEAEIEAIVEAWTRSLPLDRLEEILLKAGVPASRIFTMKDIFADPHFRARGMLVKLPDPDLESVTLAGVVPALSGTPGELRWPGRQIGEDTRQVLAEFAKFNDEEIDSMFEAGIAYGGRVLPRTQG